MLKVNEYGKIEEVNRENHELISIKVAILFYSLFEKKSFDEVKETLSTHGKNRSLEISDIMSLLLIKTLMENTKSSSKN